MLRIGQRTLTLRLLPNTKKAAKYLAPISAKVTSCSPCPTQRAATVFAFLLGAYYCLIFCVKNVRIQYMYIAVASIDNPLSRSNRYLPELGTKIQTELTTNYNMPF